MAPFLLKTILTLKCYSIAFLHNKGLISVPTGRFVAAATLALRFRTEQSFLGASSLHSNQPFCIRYMYWQVTLICSDKNETSATKGFICAKAERQQQRMVLAAKACNLNRVSPSLCLKIHKDFLDRFIFLQYKEATSYA